MARLECRSAVLSGAYDLELTSLMPSLGRADQYSFQLRLTHDGKALYDAVHSTAGWGLGNVYMWHFCNIFRRCAGALDQTVPVDGYARFGEPTKHHALAAVSAKVDWLSIYLWGRSHQELPEQRISGVAYLLRTVNGEHRTSDWLSFEFLCNISAAVRFGDDLADECRAAAETREQLGMSDPRDEPDRFLS